MTKKLWRLAGHCCCYFYFVIFGGWAELGGGGGCLHLWFKYTWSTWACVCGIDVHVCVCVCASMCAGDSVSARVFVFQYVSVSFCFVWLSMISNVLLCNWFLCEYLCIPYFCLIKWQSTLSHQTHTINSMCVGACTEACEYCVGLHGSILIYTDTVYELSLIHIWRCRRRR